MRGEGSGTDESGKESRSYILERSTVDMKEGWMRTESRNLEWTGVLSAVERQVYGASPGTAAQIAAEARFSEDDNTDVKTTVILQSRLGQRLRRQRHASTGASLDEDEPKEKVGFFRHWSQASIQRSIEAIGLRRTSKSQPNAREGLKVVLERLREGGLSAVLEGMRHDREQALGGQAVLGMLHQQRNTKGSTDDH
jgi:hypothetical protein